MEKILVVNAGSSTVKFSVFNKEEEKEIASGIVDRIGIDGSYISIKTSEKKIQKDREIKNHKVGFEILLDLLKEEDIIKSFDEIIGVGHRVVQGGEYFKTSVRVNDDVLKKIKDYAQLAPLHNIPNATGIEVIEQILPGVKNVAVFDTEFHQTLPKESYLYPVPYQWYEKHKVRRYGAHGTSHKYVTYETARLRNKDVKEEKYIVCHLGNGASLTAIKNGESYQTSMGLTPLDGVMMGTRTGTIDPAIIEYMCKELGKTVEEVTHILNFESGIKGLSGISNDFRDISSAVEKNDERAKLTLDVYVAKLVEFIGAYYFRLGGVDAIIFTAGIGENSRLVRSEVVKRIEFLGIELDEEANLKNSLYITTKESKIDVMVVPTNEEYQIFKETEKF